MSSKPTSVMELAYSTIEAANQQLIFFGIFSGSDFFKLEDLQAVMLRYQNQAKQMDILQQQCEHWLETEMLTNDKKTAVYQLEINGFKLQRLSEDIIIRLNKFRASLEA